MGKTHRALLLTLTMALVAGSAPALQYHGEGTIVMGDQTRTFEAIACTFHDRDFEGSFRTIAGRTEDKDGTLLAISIVMSENEHTAQVAEPGGRKLVAMYRRTDDGWMSGDKHVDGPLIDPGRSGVVAEGIFMLDGEEYQVTIDVKCSH